MPALLVALGAQLAWHYRLALVEHWPRTRAWLEAACVQLHCRGPVLRDPSRLHIEARDVREHPRYAGVLLVNATLVNDAPFRQDFPVLELSLYGVAGELLGRRRFTPEEYLDASIDNEAGMPSRVPVYIVLEIAAAASAAVSFEFKLL